MSEAYSVVGYNSSFSERARAMKIRPGVAIAGLTDVGCQRQFQGQSQPSAERDSNLGHGRVQAGAASDAELSCSDQGSKDAHANSGSSTGVHYRGQQAKNAGDEEFHISIEGGDSSDVVNDSARHE